MTEYIDFQLSEAELKAVKTASESKDVEKIAQALRKILMNVRILVGLLADTQEKM